jgi:hypothetical protein
MKKVFSLFVVIISVCTILTACGGGGGDSSGGGDHTAPATNSDVSWTKQLGTASDDYGFGVAVDASGNVYVTGYTLGSMDGNTSAGGKDIFLVKYDSAGTKQWTSQWGTASDDTGYGVAVDTIGNVYVTGYTMGSMDGNTSAGGMDMFLVKYDAAGTKQWTRQLGTTSGDEGNAVAVDAGGNVFVTGSTAGDLDGNTNASAGYYDMFLVKYDAAGTKQWTRQLGTTSGDEGYGVAVNAGGNVFVTGFTYGGMDGNTNAGDYDMFLVKYNAAGTKQWTRQLGTTLQDRGLGVAVDAGGNVFVTGFTYGGMDGKTNAGEADIFLVKYDSAGTKPVGNEKRRCWFRSCRGHQRECFCNRLHLWRPELYKWHRWHD